MSSCCHDSKSVCFLSLLRLALVLLVCDLSIDYWLPWDRHDSAIEALKKEEEDEERRWRTQRRAHPTSPGALCAPDVSLVHLMVSNKQSIEKGFACTHTRCVYAHAHVHTVFVTTGPHRCFGLES